MQNVTESKELKQPIMMPWRVDEARRVIERKLRGCKPGKLAKRFQQLLRPKYHTEEVSKMFIEARTGNQIRPLVSTLEWAGFRYRTAFVEMTREKHAVTVSAGKTDPQISVETAAAIICALNAQDDIAGTRTGRFMRSEFVPQVLVKVL